MSAASPGPAAPRPARKDASARYREAVRGAPRWKNPVLDAFARASAERFLKLGLPVGSDEDWRFTRTEGALLSDLRGPASPGPRLAGSPPAGVSLRRIGPGDADAPDVLRELLGDAAAAGSLEALNGALMGEVLLLSVPAGLVLSEPLVLVHPAPGPSATTRPRLLAAVGAGSSCHLVERTDDAPSDGDAPGQSLAVTSVLLEKGASLSHARIQGGGAGFRHGSVRARVSEGASLACFAFSAFDGLARSEMRADLEGPGAEARANGLLCPPDGRHADVLCEVRHLAPRTTSRQLFKTVLGGGSRGVLMGRVEIGRDVAQADAGQLFRSLLLSKGARAVARPELAIFADDVRCSHGATVGRVGEDETFYMESRGLSPERVRAMLVAAFAAEVVERHPSPAVRRLLGERFPAA